MGCFLGCFGTSSKQDEKRKRKLRQQRYGSPKSLQHHTLSQEKAISTDPSPVNPSTGLLDDLEKVISADSLDLNIKTDLPDDSVEEELSLFTRRKVTFDTNVKTCELVSVHESAELSSETEKNAKDQMDRSDNSSLLSNSHSEGDSITSSMGSYPPNHRYQNCRDSDDEIEEFDCENSDLDDEINDTGEYSDCDEDGNEILSQNVWDESIRTASMEWRTEISSGVATTEEVDSPLIVSMLAEREGNNRSYNPNGRNRSMYVHSVLNPVENIAQWKAVKCEATPTLKPQKENFSKNQEESRLSFSFMSKSEERTENKNEEISVDASLSSWLSTPIKKTSHFAIETERSYSHGSNSAISLIEDRPILGALTVEEIKQFSASNSPRKSPSRSPDEIPIIGTVGRYWNSSGSAEDYSSASSYKGIPNSTSKYREDKKVIWHSTPFETRLERALKRGDIES